MCACVNMPRFCTVFGPFPQTLECEIARREKSDKNWKDEREKHLRVTGVSVSRGVRVQLRGQGAWQENGRTGVNQRREMISG